MTVRLGEGTIVSTTSDNCNLGVGEALLEPADYIYEWPGGIFGNERTDLTVNGSPYNVTVTDDFGCTSILPVEITNECECPEINVPLLPQPEGV